jgi:hypothetical protein
VCLVESALLHARATDRTDRHWHYSAVLEWSGRPGSPGDSELGFGPRPDPIGSGFASLRSHAAGSDRSDIRCKSERRVPWSPSRR